MITNDRLQRLELTLLLIITFQIKICLPSLLKCLGSQTWLIILLQEIYHLNFHLIRKRELLEKVLITLGLGGIFFSMDLIWLFAGVSEKMRSMTSWEPVMMKIVEDTLKTSRHIIRSFTQVIIGLVFLKLQRSMFVNVIATKEWGNMYNHTRCLCNHKFS